MWRDPRSIELFGYTAVLHISSIGGSFQWRSPKLGSMAFLFRTTWRTNDLITTKISYVCPTNDQSGKIYDSQTQWRREPRKRFGVRVYLCVENRRVKIALFWWNIRKQCKFRLRKWHGCRLKLSLSWVFFISCPFITTVWTISVTDDISFDRWWALRRWIIDYQLFFNSTFNGIFQMVKSRSTYLRLPRAYAHELTLHSDE